MIIKRTGLLVCLVILAITPLEAAKRGKEGKLWLDRNTEPAEVNVNGVWSNEGWGAITLEQAPGSRVIAGDADNWRIDGVVSGRKAYLIFSESSGDIQYSAELTLESDTLLTGSYANGLVERPSDKKLIMTRKSTTVVVPPSGNEKDNARIIIYRKSRGGVDPYIFLDGRQLVWMKKDCYFSFLVSPGAHIISSHPDEQPVKIDAVAGSTYYIESSVGGAWLKIYGNVRLAPEDKAKKTLKDMKILPAAYVVADSIVSLDPSVLGR